MDTQAASTKAIDWKHVGGVSLRAAWWLLKMAFKLIALLASVITTVVVAMFQYEAPEEDEMEARRLKDEEEGLDDHLRQTTNWHKG